METITLSIPSINCSHCVHTIKMEVSELDGVSNVEGSVEDKSATITFDSPADEAAIRELLKEINYPAKV